LEHNHPTELVLNFPLGVSEFKHFCHLIENQPNLTRLALVGDIALTPDKVMLFCKALCQTKVRELVFRDFPLVLNLAKVLEALKGSLVVVKFENCHEAYKNVDSPHRRSIDRVRDNLPKLKTVEFA